MDAGIQNERQAQKLIGALVKQGIEYFCCCPGSRSTSLALGIAAEPNIRYSVHFDERGACFHAVGYAKATGKPAAVVTTSGTAVGNLLPGIMEAFNEQVPLLVITADRPPELRDCGANQTCDQTKLFSNHVRWQVDLPCPDEKISENYLSSTITHAIAMTLSCPPGPVHINCMFRDPLFSQIEQQTSLKKSVHFSYPELHPEAKTIAAWTQILSSKKRGVILAGSNAREPSEEILALADKLKWPIFADILSPLRTFSNHPSLIPHFDPILKCCDTPIEAIIQTGNRFVSKTLTQWMEKQEVEFHLHLCEHTARQDPQHLVSHRICASPKIFLQKLLANLSEEEEEGWRLYWKHLNERCSAALIEFFSEDDTLTEPSLIPALSSFLSEDWALFLANSMPIRDANQFFAPPYRSGLLLGNRGVSGIDGNIATSVGIAQGARKPTFALLGDLAFLHDLNSLAYLSKVEYPVILCVVNNGGGGIFSFLPIAKRQKSFETFFAAAHEMRFASLAAFFELPFYHPETASEFKAILSLQRKNPHSCIIEVVTDRSENLPIHEKIQEAIAGGLSACQSARFIGEIQEIHR